MLLKLKRIKRVKDKSDINQWMRAMRQAEMLLKLKRIKRQISNIKHTHLVIHIQWERERERERERLKNLRPSTGAMRGRSPERWEAEHRSDEIEKPTAAWACVYCLQRSDRAPEAAMRGRSPICRLRWRASVDGDDERAAASRRRDRGFAGVWILFVYCSIGDFFFFFLNKNLCFSVFLSVALSVCLVHWVLSLVCCWELECWVWFAL